MAVTGLDFIKQNKLKGSKGRQQPKLHPKNDKVLMSSTYMLYGGAKTGKTRTVIEAYKDTDFIYLDFDRNYEDIAQKVSENGGHFFAGLDARNFLEHVIAGHIKDTVIIIDALGSTIGLLCQIFYELYSDTDYERELRSAEPLIGTRHSQTAVFFNYVLAKPLDLNNHIAFIHHTTMNQGGEKMEGNMGAWLSLFDAVYHLESYGTFVLESSRTKLAPKTLDDVLIIDRLNHALRSVQSKAMNGNKLKEDDKGRLCFSARGMNAYSHLQAFYKFAVEQGAIEIVKIGRAKYIPCDTVASEEQLDITSFTSVKTDNDEQEVNSS